MLTEKLCIAMPISYTRSVKGMMAILISVHHYAIRMQNIKAGVIFGNLGLIGVAGFLMISGYAETYQFYNKGDRFTEHYIKKKLLRLYVPWILVTIFYCIMFWDLKSIERIIQSFLMFRVYYREYTYNWFLLYIYYIYVLLYCFAIRHKQRKIQKKSYLIFIFIVSLVWFLITYSLNLGAHWYCNSFSFFIGALFQTLYSQKNFNVSFMKKIKIQVTIISTLMIITCIFLKRYTDLEIVQTILSVSITILTCVAIFYSSHSQKFNYDILGFLGDISFEIYLLATPIYIFIYSNFEFNTNGGLIVCILLTLFCACILHKLSIIISSYFRLNEKISKMEK